MSEFLAEFQEFVPHGSVATILSEKSLDKRHINLALTRLSVKQARGSPMVTEVIQPYLESDISCIFILSEKPPVSSPEVAAVFDNRNAVLTLFIDDMLNRQRQRPRRLPPQLISTARGEPGMAAIVSEVSDHEKMALVAGFQSDESDFIVGNQLIGMAMAQLSQEYDMRFILEELLTPDGNEIYMNDIRNYCDVGEPVSFLDLWLRARLRSTGREIAIGYQRKGTRVLLNPPNKRQKQTFALGDTLIVIAENGLE
jgi:hypothetical protein